MTRISIVVALAAISAWLLAAPLDADRARAQTPVAATATATTTPPATPTPSVSITPIVATTTPTATPTEPIPSTPPPPTATPLLPEEGGPPGGVLGGHLYIDNDGSRSRTPADSPVPGSSVFVTGIHADGSQFSPDGGVSDSEGLWQVRALPEGQYIVSWQPPLRDFEERASETIPPATEVVLSPLTRFLAVNTTVTLSAGNRVLDIDFGIPPQPPDIGDSVTAPNTGGGGGSPGSWATPAVLAAVIFGVAGAALVARSRAPQRRTPVTSAARPRPQSARGSPGGSTMSPPHRGAGAN